MKTGDERILTTRMSGFGTFASDEFVATDAAWGKLAALAEGAAIAARRLRGRPPAR